ncbi:hypothetical protein [Novosphingobium sp. TH158]|uniref:hypothetical protein n=1 Tax=Novosphingobium sp. TH158 TaxID=2067455 RepID=UPI000C7BD27D|nr:hypothetical protein [Novosphingobium sp. TH158]PLK26455.1 hypothetical protein C0V78_05830 [Novosphingobium sp. TH158]
MGKYVMVVQSAAVPGKEAEYRDWYDAVHFHEICAIPGITGGRRLEPTGVAMGGDGPQSLVLYEIEADDPGAVMAEMAARSADGRITRSEFMDRSQSKLWIYADREMEG